MAKNKIDKSKPRGPSTKGNYFSSIVGMDGNPNSPAEFDASPHDDHEMYFKADDDASEVEKKRVFILNFIHAELHFSLERKIPVLETNVTSDIEIYHRASYKGTELDVCVYWPPRAEAGFKHCAAVVKFTADDVSAEDDWGVISTDAAWTAVAKADGFTLKNDRLVHNYWAPRWKYVVNALRKTTYDCYEKNGAKKPEPEPVLEEEDKTENCASREEMEEPMEVYSGCTGKIIGPKGSKINEIKKATGVKDIRMPTKDEDAPRPRARELVVVTIIGRSNAVKKARALIQEVVDEWANAPRPGRDGGDFSRMALNDIVNIPDEATDVSNPFDEKNWAADPTHAVGSWDDANVGAEW